MTTIEEISLRAINITQFHYIERDQPICLATRLYVHLCVRIELMAGFGIYNNFLVFDFYLKKDAGGWNHDYAGRSSGFTNT